MYVNGKLVSEVANDLFTEASKQIAVYVRA